MNKRLAIYVIYDKDGIIDDYIPYFLNALSDFVSHMVIVCNGKVNGTGMEKLKTFTSDVFVRQNIGFDAGAIKDVLLNLFGWEKVMEYDELLICNDTFYGPIFPLSELFNDMSKKDVDFWGITQRKDYTDGPYISVPKYLQSYFINVNSRLLKSDDFHAFWINLALPESYGITIINYEIAFSQLFSEKGYAYTSYISENCNHNYTYLDPYNLIIKYRCPIIKRKSLAYENEDELSYMGGENKNRLMELLEDNKLYDTSLIWDNLLRVRNIRDIKNTLHLDYVFPTLALNSPEIEIKPKTALVILHLHYHQMTDECLSYLNNVPAAVDIVVTTSAMDVYTKAKEFLSNKPNSRVRLVDNRGRDVSALLVACNDLLQDYEYVCFTHDKDTNLVASKRSAESFRHILLENTLASETYIHNVIAKFEKNPKLGFLNIPSPYHRPYFGTLGNEWTNNFDSVKMLMKKIDVDSPVSVDKHPFCLGTAFWCRSSAMKPLFYYNWTLSDFPPEPLPANGTINHAIERILSYVAQSQGYYSGHMMSDTYAAIRSVDLEKIIIKLTKSIEYKDFNAYQLLFKEDNFANNGNLLDFCNKYDALYIYGTGFYGAFTANLLIAARQEFYGFIVSDGMTKYESYLGYPVFYLSEIDFTAESVGVVIAVASKSHHEVTSILSKAGAKNIL